MEHKKKQAPYFSDIYRVSGPAMPERPSAALKPITKKQPPKWRLPLFISICVLLLIAGFYLLRVFTLKNTAQESASFITEKIKAAETALREFKFQEARSHFVDIQNEIRTLKAESSRYGLLSLAEVVGTVSDRVGAAQSTIESLDSASTAVISLLDNIEYLKETVFTSVVTQQGSNVLSQLSTIQTQLADFAPLVAQLKRNGNTLHLPDNANFLSAEVELNEGRQLLDTLIRWFSGTNHVAVLFLNPSEIRPAGGFPGSYAAVTVDRGNLAAIDVHSIYDPDGQLPDEKKIVPPLPLQLITTRWGGRDANWFFDFPTSAEKVLSFLNDSKIYQEQGVKFNSAIALNVNVVRDLLEVTGPIELSEYNLTLSSANFLDEVQREVRESADNKDSDPKQILKVLTPKLFSALGRLSDDQEVQFVASLRHSIEQKDLMLYSEDVVMQAYLEDLGVSGKIANQPDGDLSEYVAVVNANIGAGKSDAMITQAMDLNSQIDLEGKIVNTLTVTRQHAGKKSDPWWYRSNNRDYLQLYVPRSSRLLTAQGFEKAPTLTKQDYSDYKTDPDIEAIEKSSTPFVDLNVERLQAFDKTVFAGWLTTPMGGAKTAEVKYVNPQQIRRNKSNRYVLAIEKQPGVDSSFHFRIEAPPAYKWQENDDSVFEYSTDALSGVTYIELTLVPIQTN